MTNPSGTRFTSRAAALLATAATLAICACDDETPPPNTAVEARLQQVLDGSVAMPDVMLAGATAYYHSPAYRPWSGAAGLGDVPAQVAMRPDDRFAPAAC